LIKAFIASLTGLLVLFLPGLRQETIAAKTAATLLESTAPAEICLAPSREHAYQSRSGGTSVSQQKPRDPSGTDGPGVLPPGWPGKDVPGGDARPARQVFDPNPTFNGMAVDPQNGVVVLSDENRGALLVYDLKAGGQQPTTTDPRRHIVGGKVGLGFIAGVALDPVRREMYTVNNDGGGLVVHPYDAQGDVAPVRKLTVPHQSWGLSLDLVNDELAVTSQQYQGISIYKRTASRTDRPVRTIRGTQTGLADPHGVFLDAAGDEVFAANHGNWTEMRTYSADGPPLLPGEYIPGRFEKPSIRVYRASSNGNVPPVRTIQGTQTRLAWPMGITVDREAGELAVANYGTDQVLIFAKGASGDVAPVRILGGDETGIVGPVAVAVDRTNNELWVANYGDHTAVVFDRAASGNVAPKRIIRNALAGTPTTGFTNASAAAYDSKRDQLLVPN
jgi:DNA-binding beta-propeller fold protein YncE